MKNKIIKICGIGDAKIAKEAAILGANFIGIVFHPESKRYVNLNQAAKISYALKETNALPVAIFVNHTDDEMRNICAATDIQVVQLHGKIARAHHHMLPNYYQRIYVQSILENGELQADDGLKYLDAERDLILIDHPDPGKGNMINNTDFHYDLPYRWLLAGGLTSSNVVARIHDLQPSGVDVSSGVESFVGNKDIFLIQQFITAVRDMP